MAAVSLAFLSGALAQSKKQVNPDMVEATVMIAGVDPQSRKVTFRGPRGTIRTVQLPPDADVSALKVGDRFKVRYFEPVAFNITKPEASASAGGSAPSAATGPAVELDILSPPDAPRPGGVIARAERSTGIVEAIDAKTRRISLRRPQGDSMDLKVEPDVDITKLGVGEPVLVDYTETVALEMIPQPPPAPAGT
jgi:Cu/Ag efflux protein CusF